MRNCDRIGVVSLASPLESRMYLFLFKFVYRKVNRWLHIVDKIDSL